MLPDVGRDDREVKGQRGKGHWILIPGQRTCGSEICGSECLTWVSDIPLHVPLSLCFLQPTFQEDNCQVRLGHLVFSAWTQGRSSHN